MHTKIALALTQATALQRAPPPSASLSALNYLAGICGLLQVRPAEFLSIKT